MAPSLGDVLLKAGVLDEPQLESLTAEAKKKGARLSSCVVDHGILTEARLVSILSQHLSMTTVDPSRRPVHGQVLACVPASVAKAHLVIPIAKQKKGEVDRVVIATVDPFDQGADQAVRALFSDAIIIEYQLSTKEDLERALKVHYGPGETSVDDLSVTLDDHPIVDLGEDAPFVDAEIIEPEPSREGLVPDPSENAHRGVENAVEEVPETLSDQEVDEDDPLTPVAEPSVRFGGSALTVPLERTQKLEETPQRSSRERVARLRKALAKKRKSKTSANESRSPRSKTVPLNDEEIVPSRPTLPKAPEVAATPKDSLPDVRTADMRARTIPTGAPIEQVMESTGSIEVTETGHPQPPFSEDALEIARAELEEEARKKADESTNVDPAPRAPRELTNRPKISAGEADARFSEESGTEDHVAPKDRPKRLVSVVEGVAEEVHSGRVRDPATSDRSADQSMDRSANGNMGAAFEQAREERDTSSKERTIDLEGGRLQIGDYELIARVGVEGTAELYRAKREGGTTPLILRRMSPSSKRNERTKEGFFGASAKAALLNHPNIVRVFDVGETDRDCYVVVEAVEGPTLEKVLLRAREESRSIPQTIALHIARELLKALAQAHAGVEPDGEPVVHGGVAPRCVRFSTQGEVKLGDFGVALQVVKARANYVAPEQKLGAEIDERTDVFCAALIIFELLCGEPFFVEGNDAESVSRALSDLTQTLSARCPSLTPEAMRVLKTALDPLPEKRYERAGAFLQALSTAQPTDGSVSQKTITGFVDSLFRARAPVVEVREQWSGGLSKLRPAIEQGLLKARATGKQIAERLELERRGRAGLGRAGGGARRARGVGAWRPFALLRGVSVGMMFASSNEIEQIEVETIPIETASSPGEGTAVARKPSSKEQVDIPTKTAPAPPSSSLADEILPGISDGLAPEGFSFVARSGIELKVTAEEDAEPAIFLDVGLLVRHMGQVEGYQLVLVPPRGPTGFVSKSKLVSRKPLARLGKELAFEGCAVQAGGILDDCLYKAKQSLDGCLQRCQDFAPKVDHRTPPGSRCAQACQLAFDSCVGACRESEDALEKRNRRRRKRLR